MGRFLPLLLWIVAVQAPKASEVTELSELVRQWVALRSEIASEQIQAEERGAVMRSEIALLEKEKAELTRTIAEFDAAASEEDQTRAKQMARVEELDRSLDTLLSALDRAEEQWSALRVNLPLPLLGEAARLLDSLPRTQKAMSRENVSSRARRVVALLAAVESLQASIHGVKEVLDIGEGVRRQVDVLYLGLSNGFAVSTDLSWAATGHPTESGWVWEAQPEFAQEIRDAVDMAERQKTAAVVNLPLQIDAEKEAR